MVGASSRPFPKCNHSCTLKSIEVMTSPEIDCREDCDDLAFAVQKCQIVAGYAVLANSPKGLSKHAFYPVEGGGAGHFGSRCGTKGEAVSLSLIGARHPVASGSRPEAGR